VPLTVGFVSKWYLVVAALEQNHWIIAALVLAGSLLAVVYIGRILEAAYFNEPEEGQKTVKEVSWLMLAPMWILVLANIYFGVDTSLTTEAAQRASEMLFQNSQEINALMESLHGTEVSVAQEVSP